MSTTASPAFVSPKDSPAPSSPQHSDTSSEGIFNTGSMLCVISTCGEEGILLSPIMTSYIAAQISEIHHSSNQSPQVCAARTITFLPKETVELEIQLRDLLTELANLSITTSEPQTTSSTQLFSKPQISKGCAPSPTLNSKDSSPQTKSSALPIRSFYSSLNHEVSQTKRENIKPLFKTQTSNSLSHNVVVKEKASSSVLFATHLCDQDLLRHTPHPITKTTEHKQSKQEKEQQQHQHQQQQQKEDSNPQNKNQKTQSQTQEKVSISSLQYQSYLHTQNRVSASTLKKEKSVVFQKKAISPMAMFSEKSTSNCIDETSNTENIFIRFMRLMARILGQAEAEAHELYKKIKKRTDDVDSLTVLLSHINNEPEAIDWSDKPEMKDLVDHAKTLGVTVKDSYQWSDQEKKLLKENIQMQKENMEKITQLERTDMQRLLQEVSQCHQTRSNILKLLKELMDTFIYNLRP